MAPNAKAPTLGNVGAHRKNADCRLLPPFNLERFRVQALAARYALPIELAVMIAPLALGGAHG